MQIQTLDQHELSPCRHTDISVYVHIPFCRTRCHYCAFYLETGFSPRVLDQTLDGIVAEAELYMKLLGYPLVRTVYIGGGTPSVIPPKRLESFLGELRACLGRPEEATIEVNPESVTSQLLGVLDASWIDRISVGIQSLDDRELGILGRRSTAGRATEALAMLESGWRGRVSADYLIGVPGQTEETVRSGLHSLLSFGVQHISMYGLTVEPGTVLSQQIRIGSLVMPTVSRHERLWETAIRVCRRAGLDGYEVSNYAVRGEESRHNANYWRLNPYVGFGPGAVGTIACNADSGTQVVRLTGSDIFGYQKWRTGVLRPTVERITAFDFLFEHFMNGLRTRRGVRGSDLQRRFSVNPESLLALLLDGWSGGSALDRRSIRGADVVLRLNRPARMIVDSFLPELWSLIEEHVRREDTEFSLEWPDWIFE